jgi:nickel transport protein
MYRSLSLLAALCAALLLASPALAHKVNLYAYVEDGVIQGEGYFTGGGKPQDCPVTVTDATGKLLGETRTDTGGKFRLKLPPLTPESAPLKLVLTAGDGHRNDFPLTARDLGFAAPSAGGPPAQAAPASPGGDTPAVSSGAGQAPGTASAVGAPAALPAPPSQAGASIPAGVGIAVSPPASSPAASPSAPPAPADKAALEEAVARVLDRKLAPVNAQLAALAERADRVGSREILGGLGWIAGLFGVAFYFKGRKRG